MYRRDGRDGRDGLTREHEGDVLKHYERDGGKADATHAADAGGGRDAARDGSRDDFYGGQHFEERGFFGQRRRGRDDASYLTRSEEQLAIGKRRVEAGTVDVRKHVETERVRESVPVTHEEVTVDRRPVSADAARGADATIEDGELRIPVLAEEVVVGKRVVPTEEIVIRKHVVTEQQQVEADVRKERTRETWWV